MSLDFVFSKDVVKVLTLWINHVLKKDKKGIKSYKMVFPALGFVYFAVSFLNVDGGTP